MTKRELWATRVAEYRASGMGARKFCAGREYTAQALFYWMKQLRTEPPVAPRMAKVRRISESRGVAIEVIRTRVELADGSLIASTLAALSQSVR